MGLFLKDLEVSDGDGRLGKNAMSYVRLGCSFK